MRSTLLCCLVLGACELAFAARAAEPAALAYPLDAVSRSVSADEELPCQRGEVTLVTYKGEVVRYARPLRVHPSFRSQLLAFEAIVAELGERHFGRAPRRIVHFGAYACRPMRGHAQWLSEHALGNALDVAGFDFGPLPREAELPAGLPPKLRRPFEVRVARHFDAAAKEAAQGAFLRELAKRLIERPDVFRNIVGPGWPGHDNHLHLAHPPYRLVKVGEEVRWYR
jgi:hypothetical protein